MMKAILSAALLAVAMPAMVPTAALAQSAPAKPQTLQYLDATLFQPVLILPAPVAKDMPANARELAMLHQLIAGASPQRLKQAYQDAIHEDPAVFNETLGVDLKKLPATWELLEIVNHESAVVASIAKDHFHRMRPYSADASLPFCEGKADPAKPAYRSYPSGHSTLGYAVGVALARLLPAKADRIMDRAQDYAMSREYCGAHYASDIQASEVIGTLAATLLLNDPRLADKVAAARVELNRI